jgi:hypothetical protein
MDRNTLWASDAMDCITPMMSVVVTQPTNTPLLCSKV